MAALPDTRGLLRRSGRAIPSTPATSSPGSRSSPTGRGTSTAWPSTRTWSMPPSGTSARTSSICTRSSCGPSTPAPPTTTSPCTVTTAATAWWSPGRPPLPAADHVHLPLRRHRGRRARPGSSPSSDGQGRALHPALPRVRRPGRARRWPPSGRPGACSSTGPTSSTGVRTSPVPRASRFSILADYQVRGTTWGGKMAWPKQSPQRWAKLMPQCTRPGAGSLRIPPAGPRLLERADTGRRRPPLPGDGHGAVPGRRLLTGPPVTSPGGPPATARPRRRRRPGAGTGGRPRSDPRGRARLGCGPRPAPGVPGRR